MTMIPSFGNRHNVFYIRTTEPDTPRVDDLWFDTTLRELKIWTGAAWEAFSTDGGGIPDAPADGVRYVRVDGTWVPNVPSPIGGVELGYRWDDDTSATQPNEGDIRANSADHTLATQLYLAAVTAFGNDASVVWNGMQVGEYTGVWETSGNTEGIYYQITGITDNTGWFTIDVVAVPGTVGGMDNNKAVSVFTIPNPVAKIPVGGTTGQVLTKASDNDFDLVWTTLP